MAHRSTAARLTGKRLVTARKIFCIGMSKTGTTSLHEALVLLGFSSCHHRHEGQRCRELIEAAHAAGRPLLSAIPDYDAYSNMTLDFYLDELDAQYPGARYIHTTRKLDEWLISARKHNDRFNARQRTAAQPKPLRPTDDAAVARWMREREEIEGLIERHFRNRSADVLTMDIGAGDGWEKLCPFLGKGIPGVPFPHGNRGDGS
jgi:hypothetical protein